MPRRSGRRHRRGLPARQRRRQLDQRTAGRSTVGLSGRRRGERGTRSPRSASTAPRRARARQLAIVLDDVIQSAPVGATSRASPATVSITGELHRGRGRDRWPACSTAAPPRRGRGAAVQTVSPTLGQDSLGPRSSPASSASPCVLVLHDRLLPAPRRCSSSPAWSCGAMLIYSVVVARLADHELRPHAGRRHRHHRVDRRHGRPLRRYFERLKDEVRARPHARATPRRAGFTVDVAHDPRRRPRVVHRRRRAVRAQRRLGPRLRLLPRRCRRSATSSSLYFFTRPAVILLAATADGSTARSWASSVGHGEPPSTSGTRERP